MLTAFASLASPVAAQSQVSAGATERATVASEHATALEPRRSEATATDRAPVTPSPGPDLSSFWSGPRIAGIEVAIAGVVGLALGVGFGESASSSWSRSQSDCASATSCANRAQAVSEHDSAMTAATVATVGFIAGGALLAGGAALFLTAPRGDHDAVPTMGLRLTPSVGRDGASILVQGSF